jgi:DNA-binding MarR family transcriptional regulator
MQVLSSAPAKPETETTSWQIARQLALLSPRLNRAFRGQVRPAAGLSMPQFICLRALRHGPMSAGQLAQRFGVSRPTITRMVDGLVKKGLVERHVDPEDRRVAMTSLTTAGRALHESAEATATRSIAALVATLPPERLERIEAALEDLSELFEAADPRQGVI